MRLMFTERGSDVREESGGTGKERRHDDVREERKKEKKKKTHKRTRNGRVCVSVKIINS